MVAVQAARAQGVAGAEVPLAARREGKALATQR